MNLKRRMQHKEGWSLTDAKKRARLIAAAKFVESIPDDKFNMHHWWLPDGRYFRDESNEMIRVADGACGCAVGHMMQSKFIDLTEEDIQEAHNDDPEKQEIYGIVGDIFGITLMQAQFIFSQYAYIGEVSKEMVAKRLRFVAGDI